jgi:hypothetical protein
MDKCTCKGAMNLKDFVLFGHRSKGLYKRTQVCTCSYRICWYRYGLSPFKMSHALLHLHHQTSTYVIQWPVMVQCSNGYISW